jgi:leader peptidase (prepilin peptidase)/N-methyltransferase
MNIYPLVYGVVGAVIGSFLNVCIDRLPEGKSVISPASRCPHCQRKLRPLELIPILSYLVLGGRCRTCGEKIPLRVLWVEIGTGVLFGLIWQRFGWSWDTFLASFHSLFLIIIGGIDLEHQRVLNSISYPAIAISLLFIPLFHSGEPWKFILGGLVGFGILFLIALLSTGAMGMGDVKLALFIGLITGYPGIFLTLFLAFVAGGLIAGILLLLDEISLKDPIAFGPFLAFGGMVTLLYGDSILNWWLRRIGI